MSIRFVGALMILFSSCSDRYPDADHREWRTLEFMVYRELSTNDSLALIARNGKYIVINIESDSVSFFETADTGEYTMWLFNNDTLAISKVRKPIFDYLSSLRDQLIIKSGGYLENGQLVNPLDMESVKRTMFDEQGNPSIISLQLYEALKTYRQLLRVDREILWIEPNDHASFRMDPTFKDVGFTGFNFANCNTIQALQRITHLQMGLLYAEEIVYLRALTLKVDHEI